MLNAACTRTPDAFSWTSLEGRAIIREILQEQFGSSGEMDHAPLSLIVGLRDDQRFLLLQLAEERPLLSLYPF